MNQSAESATAEVATLEPVLNGLVDGLPAPRHAEVQAFARAFLRRAVQEDIASHSPDCWVRILMDLIEFSKVRRPGTHKVRVFNPTKEDHGYETEHTIVQIVNDDMPFLVDSVGMAIVQAGSQSHSLIHPVIDVRRDAGGNVMAWCEGELESLMHIEIDRLNDPVEIDALAHAIDSALQDVRVCVRDWSAMRDVMVGVIDDLSTRPLPIGDEEREEAQDFLRWVADDHFTFLGYREYAVHDRDGEKVLEVVPESGLGLLRLTGDESADHQRPLRELAATDLPHSGSVDALILTKTNSRATVHRPGYMDYIGVLSFDEQGTAVGEQRFIGLYTSAAYRRRPSEIPLVRQRFHYVMQRSGLPPNSHSGKALKHILESMPRDELFQSSEEELFRTALGILGLQERNRTKLFIRRDRYGRFFSVLAFIPRDRFNTDVRLKIESLLLRSLKGDRLDTTIAVGESNLAQLHVIVRPKRGRDVDVQLDQLESKLALIIRNWHDELRDILVRQHGEERGLKLTARFGRALPAGYIEAVTPLVAARDVDVAASLRDGDDLRLSLNRVRRDDDDRLRIKLFRYGAPIALSDVLPMLEDMGVRVVSEHPYVMKLEGGALNVQDFVVEPQRGLHLDLELLAEPFEEAFVRIWRGGAESDQFNRLILTAGLSWQQVAVLRAYSKYLLQTGVPFSQIYMEETVARYPLVARLLVELFESHFDPDRDTSSEPGHGYRRSLLQALAAIVPAVDRARVETLIEQVSYARGVSREAQIDACRDALEILLDSVKSLDEDRILRSFMTVIDATLRTSYFKPESPGLAGHLALKFDPARIPDLPRPRPYREIFVCGPRVEGTHLRFGPVARGGLRWSDRREDFRTEVLGLAKAQMVKNTVIVPVGAKGGFFVKRPPLDGDRDAQIAEAIACYRIFINGLLEITDNLVEGRVVPPEAVVRRDQADPYLVVAADKGTATFSDIANSVSSDHAFWLGDAFASGGSNGYDHKEMGITAKGAWESVKRHFRALGRDCQSEPFTCVGIGDMSGDVFGNGMLLSRCTKLVAAFDHRHIFIDPAPDAARSFAERARLYELPRSSWEDYDEGLISEGGGVFARTDKSIPISPEIRALLGIEEDVEQLPPHALISAVLKAPVDLLWNGGIGTYVKARAESHAEVGDRTNNALRVDGADLRCRIIGEGGNLGMTQRGRIEAALAGVLLNTDFIDNSAGVDTSDHEVNIKVLLDGVVRAGKLDPTDRNTLLASMEEEVGALVLLDNYRQNQAISLMERMSAARLGSKQHFVRTLESQGLLDRQLEFLPSDEEFAERKAQGIGLTRPELAILLSYAKLVIYQQLLESDVPEDPFLSLELARYFPEALREPYVDAIGEHRLRREIIATTVTNSIVNRMGATFLMRMREDTGRSAAEAARAFTIAREVFEARDLWTEIESLDLVVPESAQIEGLMEVWKLLRGATRWLLQRPDEIADIETAVERYRPTVRTLRSQLAAALGPADTASHNELRQTFVDRGFPSETAKKLAELSFLANALTVATVANQHGHQAPLVARVFSDLGEGLHLNWLRARIDELPVDGRWHANARGVMRDELQAQQSALVHEVLSQPEPAGGKSATDSVSRWLGRDDPALAVARTMLAEMRHQRSLDYPTLSVAIRRLAQVLESP